MKFWMRIAAPFTLTMSFAIGAQANGGMWGTGVYGGMQGCPYNYSAASGSSSYLDEIKEAQAAIKEAESQLRTKKNEKKKLEREMQRSRRNVEEVISEDFTEFIFEHIENNRTCQAYKGYGGAQGTLVGGDQGGAPVTSVVNGDIVNTIDVHGFQISEWNALCDPAKSGSVKGAVCSGARFRQSEKGRATTQDCTKGLADYRKSYAKSNSLQRDIENLENMIRRSKEDIADARQNYADEQRERQREQLEGGICVDCISQGSGYTYQKRETDWGSVIGNIGLGLAATYMGYQTNKMVADANSNIGWPTQPYPAWGYGFPFLAQGIGQMIGGGSGIYGAIGGGIGAGAFGCAGMNGGAYGMMGPYGGMNGMGVFGNPYAMAAMMGGMGGMGGGIYLPGMGPWGMAGPWGMGGPYTMGMGYPMGMMIGLAGAGMMGMPMGAMMGMPMMGAMAGGMMGMPMMGAMAGGIMGGIIGMPMGAMMGMPMMGAMAGGMMGMPMMGAMAGGMMGMPMMGAMAGGMMGMPMMGSMDGGLGAIQMQQQMMQMQMQQYQMYVQQQQAYMQQQMQRQQVVASLQQELYGLLYRIQQVQYGYGGTSYIGGSIGLGTTTIGTGTMTGVLTPLPGSVMGGATTAPIPSAR